MPDLDDDWLKQEERVISQISRNCLAYKTLNYQDRDENRFNVEANSPYLC